MKGPIALFKYSIWTICIGFMFPACNSSAETAKPAKHIVEIKAMKFEPAELTVNSGDTVVWINRDIVAHDVTEEPGKAWTSSLMQAGATWSLVVTKSADYYCSIHVVMKGKLLVR